jgi:TonB family protein
MNRTNSRSNSVRRIAIALLAPAALTFAFAAALPASASTNRSVSTRVTPNYPVAAKHIRLSGPVEIDVTIDPAGKVTNIKTLSGNPLLAAAAKDAASKWTFAPATSGSNQNIKFDFKYHND